MIFLHFSCSLFLFSDIILIIQQRRAGHKPRPQAVKKPGLPFLAYIGQSRIRMNGASSSIHIQMASFFRFMAANLIFTRLDTWDRPLYSLCAVFGMGAQMAGGTVGTNLEINFIFPVSVPVGSVAGQCFSFSHHSLLLILPHINEKAQLLLDFFDRQSAGIR